LRLAATFSALWSLLATTTLIWVLESGGWSALQGLARSPGEALFLLGPGALRLWIEGAAGVVLIFLAAFLLNQAVARSLLYVLRPVPMDWPARFPRPAAPTALMSYASDRAEAFSYTLLSPTAQRGRPMRREVVLVSDRLRELLTPRELEAVIAHELGHIRGLDGRYLTFLRTLSRMMRWDPIFLYLARTITHREEFRADDDAVRLTHRPLVLARALYKACVVSGAPRSGLLPGFVGPGGVAGRRQALARIRRLVEIAELGESEG